MLIYRRYSKAFEDGLKQTRFTLKVCTLYQFIKFALICILNTQLNNELEFWLICIQIHSCIAFLYYSRMIYLLYNNFIVMSIAKHLNHAIEYIELQENIDSISEFIQEPFQIPNDSFEVQQNTEILLPQKIRKEIVNRDDFMGKLSKITFFGNQILFLWALHLYYIQRYRLILIYIFIMMYQYSDVYITILLLLISLPFIISIKIYQIIQRFIRRINFYFIIKKMQVKNIEQFNDNICSICLGNYEINDELLTLPCDVRHHFHKSCAKQWLIINHNCPICRSQIG